MRVAAMPDILFLGTGIMGAPMARRLSAVGMAVTAWNRDPAKAEVLTAVGVTALRTLDALAPARRVAIVMVSTGAVADTVLLDGDTPATAVLTPGSTVLMMSSIPVEVARAQAARLADAGIAYVDAPVSGGEAGAIAGTLAIMAGGDAATIAALAPVFAPLGRVTHVGPVGAGSLAKLANQMIVGITIGAVAEALALAELGGADPVAVRAALSGGFADSTVLRQHGGRMIAGDYRPGAHVDTQVKDLTTARSFAESGGADFPLLALITDLYCALAAGGDGALDHSALYRGARQRAGLPPA